MKKEEKIKYLQEAIDIIDNIMDAEPGGEEHTLWLFNTRDLLRQLFGEDSEICQDFNSILFSHRGEAPFNPWYYKYEHNKLQRDAYQKGLAHAKGLLRSALERIKRYEES